MRSTNTCWLRSTPGSALKLRPTPIVLPECNSSRAAARIAAGIASPRARARPVYCNRRVEIAPRENTPLLQVRVAIRPQCSVGRRGPSAASPISTRQYRLARISRRRVALVAKRVGSSRNRSRAAVARHTPDPRARIRRGNRHCESPRHVRASRALVQRNRVYTPIPRQRRSLSRGRARTRPWQVNSEPSATDQDLPERRPDTVVLACHARSLHPIHHTARDARARV